MRTLKQENTRDFGFSRRLSFQEHELDNAPIVPIPVEYEDIDSAVIEFFDKRIDINDDNGRRFPLFTMFSNHRFSEYSQTWEHTDEDGNLMMGFKTINRENSPKWGNLYGGSFNIPGNNRFTVALREIIDDTGVECYEVTSMSQPLQIDLKYTVSIITSKYELLNEFNTMLNKLFASKQCYIRPNGHYMPMLLDGIDDNTDYTVNERKFFIQTASVTVMAYIIPKDDIKVEKAPKRRTLSTNINNIDRAYVEMDFNEGDTFELKVDFLHGSKKVMFSVEDDMYIQLVDKVNANKITVKVNDSEVRYDGRIKVTSGDDVKINIIQPKPSKKSRLVFSGILI